MHTELGLLHKICLLRDFILNWYCYTPAFNKVNKRKQKNHSSHYAAEFETALFLCSTSKVWNKFKITNFINLKT